MAECPSQVGVRNLVISFKDCDSDAEWRNVVHKMNGDTLPTVMACNKVTTQLPGGKVQVSEGNGYTFTADIQRVEGIPLAMYQGCAALDISVEWYDGSVWTLINGSVTDATESDGNTITLTASFQEFDEILAVTQLDVDSPLEAA